eukprot:3663738-Pleurochrysis_carterae.AAC.1
MPMALRKPRRSKFSICISSHDYLSTERVYASIRPSVHRRCPWITSSHISTQQPSPMSQRATCTLHKSSLTVIGLNY